MMELSLGIAPVLIIGVYIYSRDKYEKEPIGMLIKSLLIGILIVIPIAITELWLVSKSNVDIFGIASQDGSHVNIFDSFYVAFIVAALSEEGFKYGALYYFIWKNKNFNEYFDGIVYAVFISLGFAGVENVLYVFLDGMNTGIARLFLSVPAHALFGVVMGYYLSMAKYDSANQNKLLRKALFYPVLLHGIFDFILMSGRVYLMVLFVPFLIYLWVSGFKKLKHLSEITQFNPDSENYKEVV